MPVEAGWEPVFGPNKLVGHYKVGFAYDTSDFNNLATASSGAPLLLPTQTPAITSGRTQFWVSADQLIMRQGETENAGITLLATYASSSSRNSVTWQTVFAGILDKGFGHAAPMTPSCSRAHTGR